MDRPRRDSRQHYGIMLRGLPQPTFATKSALSRHGRCPEPTSTLSRDCVTTAGQLQRQGSPGLQLPSAPPRADLETGSPLRGRPPLDADIRQRFEYSRCAFQAGDCTCTFEGSYQCGCGRRCARGSETAPPKMPVSYTHLRAHETRHDIVCRLLLE